MLQEIRKIEAISIVFFVICSIGITSCGALKAGIVSRNYDEFEQRVIHRLEFNELSGGGFLGTTNIYLDAQRVKEKDGSTMYSLVIRYMAEDWLFIEDGESLVMLVDGERIAFSGNGSLAHREIVGGRLCCGTSLLFCHARST